MTNPSDEISIADQLLKQLQDQYLAVHAQNIVMPQQNSQPENDPQNLYQPLQFDDDQNYLSDQSDQAQQKENEAQQHVQEQEKQEKQEEDVESFKKQIQSLRIQQAFPNPQSKELIQVQPVDQKIFTDLPVKDFEIDEQKIKSFALSMEINQPDWLKNQSLCKVRIEELFIKKSLQKPFTKI